MESNLCYCPACGKIVLDNCKAIECDLCQSWYHLRCSQLSTKLYNYYTNNNDLWLCRRCRNDTFPYNNLDDRTLFDLSFNSNTKCLCSKTISNSKLDSMTHLDILSSLENIPNLTDVDAERNVPSQTNFKNYSTHDFHNDEDISNSFSE